MITFDLAARCYVNSFFSRHFVSEILHGLYFTVRQLYRNALLEVTKVQSQFRARIRIARRISCFGARGRGTRREIVPLCLVNRSRIGQWDTKPPKARRRRSERASGERGREKCFGHHTRHAGNRYDDVDLADDQRSCRPPPPPRL